MKLSRAQVISIDVIVALVAFTFALLSVMLAWTYLSNYGSDSFTRHDMDRITHQHAAILFSTPGEPIFWYNESVQNISAIGLTKTEGGMLDMNKLYALNRSDLETSIANYLGVAGFGYSYYVLAIDPTDDQFFLHGTEPVDATYVSVREVIMYNGSEYLTLRMGVWV